MKPSKNSDLGKQTRLTRPPWREEGAAFPSFLARVVAHRIHESLEPAALVLEPRERPKPGFPPLSPDRPIMYTQPPLNATSNLPFAGWGGEWLIFKSPPISLSVRFGRDLERARLQTRG